MKRQLFLKTLLATSSLLAVSFNSVARKVGLKRETKGFKVDAGNDRSGKPISLLEGDKFYTKVSAKDTDGDLYIFESTREKNGGPTLHYHYAQDEWWYITEGEFLFKVGENSFTARAGDTVFGPRGVPHAFAKTNDGNAKMLITFQPAGKMEEFFLAISEGKMTGKSQAEQDEFRKLHGFERVGPPLTYFKKF